jgi:hypothetical protein
LLIPIEEGTKLPPSTLATIRIESQRLEGKSWMRVFTEACPLFQEFHAMLTSIADSIQLDHELPIDAVRGCVASWMELLRSIPILSPEAQTGLWGELWALRRLIGSQGPSVVEAWTGALDEPHDFRLGLIEMEVKTTRSRRRIHTITSLSQLSESLDRRLYLLSLQLEPAAGSNTWSVKTLVDDIRNLLALDVSLLAVFNQRLKNFDYRDEDSIHYLGSFQLRSQPVLIRVNDDFPRITTQNLHNSLGEVRAHRITEVRYGIDVSDMGFKDGTSEFLEILPAVNSLEATL